VLSRARASSSPSYPCGRIFLSVGGAAAPAASGGRLGVARTFAEPATDSHSALPPIRIHSDRRGPEAVVIDTSGFGQRPAPAEHDIAQSQLPETEVGDAIVRDDDDNPAGRGGRPAPSRKPGPVAARRS
jgi:hypothetical protein